jgi:hypothetical protein
LCTLFDVAPYELGFREQLPWGRGRGGSSAYAENLGGDGSARQIRRDTPELSLALGGCESRNAVSAVERLAGGDVAFSLADIVQLVHEWHVVEPPQVVERSDQRLAYLHRALVPHRDVATGRAFDERHRSERGVPG